MHKLARFADARNTTEGKILSVIMAFLLAFSLLNAPAYAEDMIKTGDEGINTPTSSVDASAENTSREGVASEATTPADESLGYDPIQGPAADPELAEPGTTNASNSHSKEEASTDPADEADDEVKITVPLTITGPAILWLVDSKTGETINSEEAFSEGEMDIELTADKKAWFDIEAEDGAAVTVKAYIYKDAPTQSDETSEAKGPQEPVEPEEVVLEQDEAGYYILDAELVNDETLDHLAIEAESAPVEDPEGVTESPTEEPSGEITSPENPSGSEENGDSDTVNAPELVESSDFAVNDTMGEVVEPTLAVVESDNSIESAEGFLEEDTETFGKEEVEEEVEFENAENTLLASNGLKINVLAAGVESVANDSFSLSDTEYNFQVGESDTLKVSGPNSKAKIEITVEKPGIVTVTQPEYSKGVLPWSSKYWYSNIEAVGVGETNITVTVDGVSEKVKVVVQPKICTVTFNRNNGSGNPPDFMMVEQGGRIILPGKGDLKRSNYVFMGWSTENGFDAAYNEKGLYKPGVQIVVDKSMTLYAVWMPASYSQTNVKFYIRYDGQIIDEPASNKDLVDKKYYTGIVQEFGASALEEHVFIADTSGVRVKANLNNQPTYNEIKTAVNKISNAKDKFGNSIDFDHYDYDVIWYVCKYNSDGSWHIDGTLVRVDYATLSYLPNPPVSNFTGDQIDPDTFQITNPPIVKSNPWTIPGFEFVGWNTQEDGRGELYNEGDIFDVSEAGQYRLYAQWREINSVQIKYAVVSDGVNTLTSYSEYLNPEIGEAKGSTAQPAEGYRFAGWYSDPECKNLLSENPENPDPTYVPTKATTELWVNQTTYYAKFEKDEG